MFKKLKELTGLTQKLREILGLEKGAKYALGIDKRATEEFRAKYRKKSG